MQDNNDSQVPKGQERLIDAQVGLLQLAEKLGNIAEACRTVGIARSSFYEIKNAYEKFGRLGLVQQKRGRRSQPIEPETEEKVLEYTRRFPSYSYVRLADKMQIENVGLGESVVKRVWKKHGLLRRMSRFLWLDREAADGRGFLTEGAIKAIRRLKALDIASEQHVEVSAPGELICQDLYLVGTIKGVGRVYMQSAVDCFSSVGFARLCVSKQPIHSVALVHERILPFYDGLALKLQAILTDQGREYCGRIDGHFFELYLGGQGIEHRTTQRASPWTNGFVERFHRTLKEEFFSVKFRERWYESVDDLQRDLDRFLIEYNEQRPHSGYRNQGNPPMVTLRKFLEQPNQEKTAA